MQSMFDRLVKISEAYLKATETPGTSRVKDEFARYAFINGMVNSFADDNDLDWADQESTTKHKPITRLAQAIVKG